MGVASRLAIWLLYLSGVWGENTALPAETVPRRMGATAAWSLVTSGVTFGPRDLPSSGTISGSVFMVGGACWSVRWMSHGNSAGHDTQFLTFVMSGYMQYAHECRTDFWSSTDGG